MANNCNGNTCGTGSWNGPLPGDPDNSSVLTATSEYGGILLNWTYPNLHGYAVAHTRIFRNTSADLAGAIGIGVEAGGSFFDRSASDTIQTYFYWIQHVSVNGTILAPVGPASSIAKPLIDKVIQDLANRVETTMLASALRSRIEKIADLEIGLTNTNELMASEDLILANEILGLRDDLTDALAYVQESRTLDVTARQALVTSLNTQLSQINLDLYAAIQEETTTRADETGDLFAQKFLKFDLAGNVSGYGLSAKVDPAGNSESEFQIRADRFSIAAPSVVSSTAPTHPFNGLVWVDTSVTPAVTRWYNQANAAWQTTPVKGSVPFIVRTTPEVIDGYTVEPGVYIDTAFIGKLSANQIDTRGLIIKDVAGNVIIAAGNALDWSKFGGGAANLAAMGYTGDLNATRNVHRGDWTVGEIYAKGDMVVFDGYGWACETGHVADVSKQPPVYPASSNTYWTIAYVGGGGAGVNGTRTASIEMYKWALAEPTTFPNGTSTYTWNTGEFTAPSSLAGWSMTPPAPVAGQVLWSCRTVYADSDTTPTSAINWNATKALPIGSAGSEGSPGSNGTRTGVLEVYQWALNAPTVFPGGTSTYTWSTGLFTAPSTANSWSINPGASTPGFTLWGCKVVVADTGTSPTSVVTWNANTTYAVGAAGNNGVPTLNAVLSNEAHVFPASATGTVSSYTGSGTEIRVYEGATELVYDGTGTANGTWKVISAGTNITPGGLTDSGTYCTVGAHLGVADGTDLSSITYTITGKSTTGTPFTITKQQSFSKSKAGAAGTSPTAYWLVASAPAIQKTIGGVYTPASLVFTGKSQTGSSAPADYAARFIIATSTDGSTFTDAYTSAANEASKSYTPPANIKALRCRMYQAGGTTTLLDEETIAVVSDGATGSAGAAAIAAVLSNETHVFPAALDGTVSSYTGSGTEIRVYEGATELAYDGVGTANGSWRVTTAATNITVGSLTDSGTYLTVGQHSAVAAGTDTSSITYTITGKTSTGASFTITKTQSFSKSKTGATGAAGPSVLITSSRATTYTATDGSLDASQTDVVFTANVSGIGSPTYVWSFSGFQTAPVNSGASTQTITAAQFGTAKSATVTCTVNGTYKDMVTIVRLEKSSAAAGATVGATFGVNIGGKITPGNVSTFIDSLAVGTAQLADASVQTLKIGLNAVTVPDFVQVTSVSTTVAEPATWMPWYRHTYKWEGSNVALTLAELQSFTQSTLLAAAYRTELAGRYPTNANPTTTATIGVPTTIRDAWDMIPKLTIAETPFRNYEGQPVAIFVDADLTLLYKWYSTAYAAVEGVDLLVERVLSTDGTSSDMSSYQYAEEQTIIKVGLSPRIGTNTYMSSLDYLYGDTLGDYYPGLGYSYCPYSSNILTGSWPATPTWPTKVTSLKYSGTHASPAVGNNSQTITLSTSGAALVYDVPPNGVTVKYRLSVRCRAKDNATYIGLTAFNKPANMLVLGVKR